MQEWKIELPRTCGAMEKPKQADRVGYNISSLYSLYPLGLHFQDHWQGRKVIQYIAKVGTSVVFDDASLARSRYTVV